MHSKWQKAKGRAEAQLEIKETNQKYEKKLLNEFLAVEDWVNY